MILPAEHRRSDALARSLGIGSHDATARHGEHFAGPSSPARLAALLGRTPTRWEHAQWLRARRANHGEDPNLEQYRRFCAERKERPHGLRA